MREEMMNQPSVRLTLWALALCLLLTTAVSPSLAKTQAGSCDTSSDTIKKSKKKSKKALPSTDDQSTAQPASPSSSASLSSASPATSASAAAPRNEKVASGNSSPEIAAAKFSGKVWVNLDSGIYHKGGRWYGKTKSGKFMTEAEAKAAGYKQSRRD